MTPASAQKRAVNARSPIRVFERSIHGGLGAGNLGVVVARPGLGKSALLAQIALDCLMHEKRVLHVSFEYPVERIRVYYDELFHDLVITLGLAQSQMVRLEIERNRLIVSHLDGATSAVAKIRDTIAFAQGPAQFKPECIIIEGFDFERHDQAAVQEIRNMVAEIGAECWLSARADDLVAIEGALPASIAAHGSSIDVVVALEPEQDIVRMKVVKDHDSVVTQALSLRLHPTTMRIVDGELPPPDVIIQEPSDFHLYSGGARGAESAFGECAAEWGLQETHFSFAGHPFRQRPRGVVELDDAELSKGDFSLVYASHRLGRPLTQIPNIKRILQTVWHQISVASEVFVIGAIQQNGTVRGGTGWGAELARLWHKPICVFDQERGVWFRWDSTQWRIEENPRIQRRQFAGLGTMRLTHEGRRAIEELFRNSFGQSVSEREAPPTERPDAP